MFAKRTLKRAEARAFHTNHCFNEAAMPKNFYAVPHYTDAMYSIVAERNNAHQEFVRHLDKARCEAADELYTVKNLPWWRKIFMA